MSDGELDGTSGLMAVRRRVLAPRVTTRAAHPQGDSKLVIRLGRERLPGGRVSVEEGFVSVPSSERVLGPAQTIPPSPLPCRVPHLHSLAPPARCPLSPARSRLFLSFDLATRRRSTRPPLPPPRLPHHVPNAYLCLPLLRPPPPLLLSQVGRTARPQGGGSRAGVAVQGPHARPRVSVCECVTVFYLPVCVFLCGLGEQNPCVFC